MGLLSGRQKFGFAALLLAASALLSRLMGLIRDKIISWQFGASGESDMYFAAFVAPDIINYMLAGGFMSITLIPLLARGFEDNEDEAWRFFSCILLWMFLASTFLTTLGEILAIPLAGIVAPGFDAAQRVRLAFFMRLILPAQVFFLCGACFTALLFLRRQFAAPALTPLIYNGLIILCGLAFPLFAANSGSDMTGYCIGVTAGAALGAFALPCAVAIGGGIRLRPVLFHPWLGKYLLLALPLMLGQTVVMLDEQFLRVFGSMLDEGSVSLLNYGRRIAQVPVALMGQAIAVASYPFLVRLLAKNQREEFHSALNGALASGVELIIPIACWMIVAARPILAVIFLGGRFGMAETIACAPLTQLMLAATPFWILYMVLVRGYYALADTVTPALTGTLITLVCIPIYYFIALPLGAWAIALVSGMGICAYTLWLMLIWAKREGPQTFARLGSLVIKSLACSLPAALAAWAMSRYCVSALPVWPSLVLALIDCALSGLAFGLCFCALAIFINPGLPQKLLKLARLKKN